VTVRGTLRTRERSFGRVADDDAGEPEDEDGDGDGALPAN
jgi:hypothetical protein